MRTRILEIFAFALVLAGLTSCVLDLRPEVPPQPETTGGIHLDSNGEMPVRIGYVLDDEYMLPGTKASIIGGNEYPNLVQTMHLLCFTVEGIFLGTREASFLEEDGETITPEQGFADGCRGRVLFSGSVPSRTARIHFVANAASKVPTQEQVGTGENILIHSASLSNGVEDQNVSYWGFVGMDTPDSLAHWLCNVTTDENGKEVYSKKEGSIVHLMRDRARVHFGNMFDFFREDPVTYQGETLEPNSADYKILSIDWILSNGLKRGYIVPYNPNANDHYANYYDPENDPPLAEDRLTPFDKFEEGETPRFAAQEFINEVDQMMRVWTYDENNQFGTVTANPLYLYEDANDPMNPPKIILRVKYQKHRNRTDVADQVVKYHTLMMMTPDNKPCRVLRNHSYRLTINGLPWEYMGSTSFDNAVSTTEYANNRTVTIDERVDNVTDGDYQLTILGPTSILHSDLADRNTHQYIDFSFEAVPDGAGEITADYDIDNFEIGWVDEVIPPTFASTDVRVDSYNWQTGLGRIRYTLGTVINENLQSGTILLREKTTNMSRYINIYSVTHFSAVPDGQTHLVLLRDGVSTKSIAGVDCPVYKMNFELPGDFPSGFFPLHIRMASSTLAPYKCVVDGDESAIITIVMGPTENGGTIDGEVLGGMTYTVTPGYWNTRETGSPWDYWYTYTILTKPFKTVNGVSVIETTSKIYTIYFADVRALRAEGNRSTDVGLFLKVKYFGDAISVTVD